jgi:N-acetylmuramoyl-L-alanine amidase
MRKSSPGTHHHRLVAAAVLVALCALLLPAAVALAASPEPAASQDTAGGSPAPAADPSPPPTTITCVLSQASVVYGGAVTVSGVVEPVAAGQEVAIAVDGVDEVTALTDPAGAYTADITPRHSGDVTARVVADGTLSEPQHVVVKPSLTIVRGTPVPFLSLGFVLKIEPSAWTGVVTVREVHRGKLVATVKGRCRDGRVALRTPLRGIGRFDFTFVLPAASGLGERSIAKSVVAKWHALSVGSSGPAVKGLLTVLNRLKIHVPGIGTRFTSSCKDAVMAFQKAYRLPRTYKVGYDDWRKLDGAVPVKPRHSGPATHLEVDKGRQILMIVKSGKVYGLICVSTGATGNTPEGAFHIQQKHPYTTSGYGGILFRTMGFVGNFAIHGYVPVPPYPASHGCIREPMWAAAWVYDRSFVGERLYVYH